MIESTEGLGEQFKVLAHEYASYLEDIRRRIILCAVLFATAFGAGFMTSPVLIHTLVDILTIRGVQYVVTSPFDVLSLSVSMGFFLGIASVFPLVLVELYEFLRPALTGPEHRLMLRYSLASLVLFLVGFGYGLVLMYSAGWAVALFNDSLGLVNLWNLQGFVSLMLLTSVLLGLLFQMPLIVSALIEFGIVSREFFVQKRRIVIASTVVIVALLPPTDGLSLVVMAVPLIGLYELTLAFSRTPRGKRALLDTVYS